MTEFERYFPGAKTFRLTANYRSHTEILDAANRLIAHDPGRQDFRLVSDDHGTGGMVTLTEAANVELEGIERLFEPGDSQPEVRGFWTVDAVGREGTIAGVRDLALLATAHGEELHLVTGNVDSRDKESVLIQDYPGGRITVATHFRCALPSDVNSGELEGEFVREFPDLPRVEGIAITEGGRFFYVTDEDEGVYLRLTRLLAD